MSWVGKISEILGRKTASPKPLPMTFSRADWPAVLGSNPVKAQQSRSFGRLLIKFAPQPGLSQRHLPVKNPSPPGPEFPPRYL